VGENIQKVFAYGLRNTFGMDFDPASGELWLEPNGDDSFTEIDRVEPGMNGGWVQVMGPLSRIAQFKAIETSTQFFGLRSLSWCSPNTLQGGHVFHFNLTGNRRMIGVDDPRLEDRVADNVAKFEITESETLLFGTNFGIGTDIRTGPNGNLFVVSLSNGTVYEIFRR
jgi:hypothetical protein